MIVSRRAVLAALLAPPGALERMQQVMGPFRVPAGTPRVEVLSEVDEGALRRRLIRYESEEGDWVPAWWLELSNGKHNGRAAICLHQTTKIGKDEPAGLGGLKNLHYGRELAERGFTVLAPDYPNFGGYSIDVYARGYLSATMKGIVNHMRGVSLLGDRPVAAIGHSLGGHNSLFLAAFDPRVKAVVTSCGFTSFVKYYGGNLKGWSHKGYMPRIESEYGCDPKRMPFDFADVLGAIVPRALFINAPVRDANFEVSGVDDCVEAVRAKAGKLVVVHPECGHDFPEEVRLQAYRFIEEAI